MASTRVLVVANRTAATPALLDAVRERAARGACSFTLLVPNPVRGLDRATDPEDHDESEGAAVLELALPLLEQAAGGPVEGQVGDAEALAAIQDAVNLGGYERDHHLDAADARLALAAPRPAAQGRRAGAAGHHGHGGGPGGGPADRLASEACRRSGSGPRSSSS